MIIGLKDAVRLVGISVMICCAVFVCNLFLNYGVDMKAVSPLISDEQTRNIFETLKLSNRVVCLITGGCLVATSVILLVFYIGHYIEKNSRRLGALKALGYTNGEIARGFAAFGLSALTGCAAGLGGSWILMPFFYSKQAENHVLPEITLRFNAEVFFPLLLLPALFFGAVAVFIAFYKLRQPVMQLLRAQSAKSVRIKKAEKDRPFLLDAAFSVFSGKKSLIFFIGFGGFCVSAMLQMGMSMKDYASDMMGAIIIIIGIVLAATSLYLALTTIVGSNAKTIAMLRIFGYNNREIFLAVLGLYHLPSYVGFALGSVYQWGLLNVMVNVVFGNYPDVPVYNFDWQLFAVTLAVFIVAYELVNLIYSAVIRKTSLKAVMGE